MYKYLAFILLLTILHSCASTKVINNDELLLQSQTNLKRGLYSDALEGFNLLKSDPKYYKQSIKGIVEAYTQQGKNGQLINILEQDHQARPNQYLTSVLAALQRDQGNITEALYYYQEFERGLSPDSKSSQKVNAIIAELQQAQELLKNPYQLEIEKLDFPINTDLPEYSPSFNLDESTLIFTRLLNGQEDLFEAIKIGDHYDVTPISSVNTRYNEGAQSISGDGSRLIFTHCNERFGYGSCDLYQALRQDNRWSKPVNIGPTVNTGAWESHPSLSEDGRTLYFASNRPGGLGGSDIWLSTLQEDSTWTTPQNLGSVINTSGNERSPFIHADGLTLYYSSDGLVGIGGQDLYRSSKDGDIWSYPMNCGSPINTPFDDNNLVVSTNGTYGFLSREDTLGNNRDLYKVAIPNELRPIPITYLKYVILDSETVRPLSALITVDDLEQGKPIKKLRSNDQGVALSTVPLGDNLSIHVESKGYIFHSENVYYPSLAHGQQPFIDTILLQPLIVHDTPASASIVLKNIFFDSGSAILKSESQGEIDYLAKLMNDNTEISIVLVGHTDNVGKPEDNLSLSIRRSQAVKDALIDMGISSERIEAEGRGEMEPIADNGTSQGRATNRRTELKVKR